MLPSRAIPILFVASALCACGTKPSGSSAAPVKTEAVAHESDLLRLTLSPEAQSRLGIQTVHVEPGSKAASRETSGEIVVPAGAGGVPTNSLSNLQQLGTQQVAADGEVARAQAQLRLAHIALDRAAALVREEAGSVRARDEASAAFATAQAAADVAGSQRRMLGPSMRSLSNQTIMWVRVPVFGTDVTRLTRGGSAMVTALGAQAADGTPRTARPIQAPPSANALAGTVDLYFAINNSDHAYRVGQRVAVGLSIGGGAREGLAVPTSAIVRDIYGGLWVYQKTAPDTYVRQRIEIAATAGDRAILSRGLAAGAEVVSVGAAELFGSEFGVAH